MQSRDRINTKSNHFGCLETDYDVENASFGCNVLKKIVYITTRC